MELFDAFTLRPTVPRITSILLDLAQDEIRMGRLPILNTDTVLLKDGEHCHYIDKAIYEKRSIDKQYVKRNQRYSIPGFLSGTKVHLCGAKTEVQDREGFAPYREILYITNRRMIFGVSRTGFKKAQHDDKPSLRIWKTEFTRLDIIHMSPVRRTIICQDGDQDGKSQNQRGGKHSPPQRWPI